MQLFAATTLFTKIFGDSPTEIVVNALVILMLSYMLWRTVIAPLLSMLRNFSELFKRPELSCIEVTPPQKNEIDPDHTQNFVHVIQRLYKTERLSLEVISSKKKGIRYKVMAEPHAIKSIKKHLSSYMPDLKITASKLTSPKLTSRIYSFKLSRHFAYPLKTYETTERTDPMTFIAGAMTSLEDDEELSLQMVVRPYSSRSVSRIYNKIIKNGRAPIGTGIRYYLISYAWVWVPSAAIAFLTTNLALGLMAGIIIWVIALFSNSEARPLTITEEKLYSDVIAKLDQPLARVSMRLSVHSPKRTSELVDDFQSSLKSLDRTGIQSIVRSKGINYPKWQKYLHRQYAERLSSIVTRNALILSASELAAIYHFPYGVIHTEGMVRSHSKTLPAPLSLKDDPKLDVVFGVNKHHDTETPIGLTIAERERHMYVIGGTGSGKTTMLKYQIIQDIKNGKGLAVVDPHGDLAEELLKFVPKDREKDLVYLNPDDLDNPIGVNLLEMPEGLSGNDLLGEKDRVTESVVSVMRKIFSEDDSGGHRIEYVLRNAVQTALTTENPTLFTIFRLLNDGKYAKGVIKKLEDEDLKAFWKNELGKAGSMQKVKMAAGITSKIGRFLFSASARAMLEQEKSDIDFGKVLDSKILICNFSKGRLGEDTSMLFGTTILAKLQLAALKRSEHKQTNRKPFYLYVDEFQNFATVSFTQVLSEARKYKLYLIMAEQSTQQQDDQKMIEIILANVGTVVVFRTGSPKDEELLLPLFEPYIERGEISNLPAYNFYCRISGIETSEPMSGKTIVA